MQNPNFNLIPAELKALNRWILWRLETRDGKPTKVPYRVDGKKASATNPHDWTDFETVCNAFNSKLYSGIGFVFHKPDGFVGVDLDGCVFNGVISSKAMEIICALNSYTELSPSGNGVHIIVRAMKHTNKSKVVLNDPELKAIEVYSDARYFTVTGAHIENTPLHIEERQAELKALCEKYFSAPETHAPQSPESHNGVLSDERIIDLCRKAKNADKFSRLFDYGDVSEYANDESAADAALCALLAFYTTDPVQIERLFSRSALARREKWQRREDYRRRTIQNTLSQVREHYAPTNPTNELTSKYGLQSIAHATPADADDFEDDPEPPELESYANIDFAFDETLVPNGLFRELYEHFKREADAPPQFIFTTTLAAFMGITGTNISLTCGTLKIKSNDYFALLTKSGNGKSTSLEACRAVLDALEKRIIHTPYCNVVLFPQSSTLRGLLDCMRDESEAELRAREAMEAKGKPTLPPKIAQRSGVAIIDEVSSLFDATRNEFNTGLDSTLLLLWDGNARTVATSAKNDGKMNFGDSALTLLSASTPKKFVERLPKGAMLDGMIPRFQFVFADSRKRPRKALTSLTKAQATHDAIVDKLLLFFQFIRSTKRPVIVSDEAKVLDETSVRMWYDESLRLDDETADGYMQRIDTRKVRYALLFSTLETYDQHGQFADAITISGTAMERAIRVCEFYKAHALHFIVKAKAIRPKAPNENEPLFVRVKNKLIELGGTADKRTLQRALNLKKEPFTDALNELLATKQVVLIQRENPKGRLVDVVTIPKNSKNGYDSYDSMTVCENNTTETLPKPQNEAKCHKSKCHNPYDSVNDVASPEPLPEPTASDAPKPEPLPDPEPTAKPEPTVSDVASPEPMPASPEPLPEPPVPEPPVPEPPVPEPTVSPEPMPASPVNEAAEPTAQPTAKPEPLPVPPQPMPADVALPESLPVVAPTPTPKHSLLLANACEIARSLHAEFSAREFTNEAMLFHGATSETAKQMLNALLREGYILQGKYTYVRTSKLCGTEPKPKPVEPDADPAPF